MSTLKKIGIILLSFIVVLLLSLTVFTSSLSKLTSKDFIKDTALGTISLAKPVIFKQYNIKEEDIKQGINLYCSNPDLIKKINTIPINKLPESTDVSLLDNIKKLEELGLSCDNIKNKEIDDIIKITVPNIINTYYEKDYSCDYLDCISKDSINALETTFNKKGHNFFSMFYWIFLIISIILLILIFLLSENRLSGLKNVGINLTISGVTFIFILIFKLTTLESLIPSDTEPFLKNIILGLTSKIINVIQNRFLLLFIIGIILIIISIALKYLKPGEEQPKGGIIG